MSYQCPAMSCQNNKNICQKGANAHGGFGNNSTWTSEDLLPYRQMAQRLVMRRNRIAHCSSLDVLDDRVYMCEKGLEVFTDLENEIDEAVHVVRAYDSYKAKLPYFFQ